MCDVWPSDNHYSSTQTWIHWPASTCDAQNSAVPDKSKWINVPDRFKDGSSEVDSIVILKKCLTWSLRLYLTAFNIKSGWAIQLKNKQKEIPIYISILMHLFNKLLSAQIKSLLNLSTSGWKEATKAYSLKSEAEFTHVWSRTATLTSAPHWC